MYEAIQCSAISNEGNRGYSGALRLWPAVGHLENDRHRVEDRKFEESKPVNPDRAKEKAASEASRVKLAEGAPLSSQIPPRLASLAVFSFVISPSVACSQARRI